MRIQIPPAFHDSFASFKALTPAQGERLVEALRVLEPTRSLSDLGPPIATATGLGEEPAAGIAGFLVGLMVQRARAMGHADHSLDDFADAVCDAAETSGKDELAKPKEGWGELKKLLRGVLSQDSGLAVSSKAMEIIYRYERLMTDARVISDLRPVFGEDPSAPPAAAAVVHSLSIDYLDSRVNEHRTFLVMMDSDDIRTLQRQLERALSKERSLNNTIRRADMKVLDFPEDKE